MPRRILAGFLRRFRHQVLLSGCVQWHDLGRDRVVCLREQEYLDPSSDGKEVVIRRQEDRILTGRQTWCVNPMVAGP